MTRARQRPKALDAYLNGRKAGTFTQDPQVLFSYDPDYLADARATPLSLSMPLADATYRQSATLPWLDGLLPDSQDVRVRWAQQFGVSATNGFALLTHMGLDTPGAVQLVPAGTPLRRHGRLEPLDEKSLGSRLRALRSEPDGWTTAGERWSLGGAQSKFALRWSAGWFEAIGEEPTTHIIKPGVSGFRGQGLNEHLTMTAARTLGLGAADTRYEEFDGEPAIIVTRFDRAESDGTILRAHQEDICMALSVARGRKYEDDGGPGAATIVDLLRGVGAGTQSIPRFLDALVFNYLIGASDAHAKNYSLLLRGPRVTLAPLYDIASSLPYDAAPESALRKLAMAIGGEKRFGTVGQRHWARLARRAGADPEWLWSRIADLAAKLPDALSSAIAATSAVRDSDLPARYLDRLVDYLRAAGHLTRT